MKLKIVVCVFAAVCFSNWLQAQSASDLPANSFPYNLAGQSVMTFDNRYEGVKGTYTFFEEFRPGIVELNKGRFSNVLINYDAFTDNLLTMNDKIKEVMQIRKDMVIGFVLISSSGQEFSFSKQSFNGTPAFLLVLVPDTISLFCRISKTIKKADFGGAYRMNEIKYDEFVLSNTFYVARGIKELQELQKNKRAVLQMFPEFKDQLSAYLKQNKVDYNDQEDLKRLIQYVNGLKE